MSDISDTKIRSSIVAESVEWRVGWRHKTLKLQDSKMVDGLESNISLLVSTYKSLSRFRHDDKTQKNEFSSHLDVPPFAAY